MKKRTRIKILGIWFKLEHLELKESEGLFADCCIETKTIRICESLTGVDYTQALQHEKCHALLRLSGLVELMDDKLEEAICVLMEQM